MTARPARAKRAAMLTVAQAAERLGFDDYRQVYPYLHAGLLPYTRYPSPRNGGKPGPIRIAETDVDAFIKEHRRAS